VTAARTTGGYAAGQVTVHRSPAEIAPVTRALRASGRKVLLIPTMGALHAGHRELIRHARRAPGSTVVVVSIFVNPLQFGAGEDLDRYPRTLESDVAMCAREGVDVVFAPTVGEMYPDGEPVVTVEPGPLGAELEGASRPGHFRGVLTVVAKLFGVVRPDVAVFGQKDYQQLVLVTRMSRDLDLRVEVVGAETVREPDGLALSSRNRYLSVDERQTALVLSQALQTRDVAAGLALFEQSSAVLDYLERVDSATFEAAPDGDLLVVAAKVGSTRLIDNLPL